MRRRVALSLLAAIAAPLSLASAQFGAPSYSSDKSFANAFPNQETMGMAFDGTYYWSADGGGNFGTRLTQYNASGTALNGYAPGLDFRSIFTNASGTVFGRQFADNTIYQMTAPGVFSALIGLSGGSLDVQAAVVLNGAGNRYIALDAGSVDQWDLAGNFIGSTVLTGFGTLGSEGAYPENRGIASFGNTWLTYADGVLSMWDENTGTRLGTTILNGAGQNFESYFSFSHADDGRVWVADSNHGNWQGYPVTGGAVSATPEPASVVLVATGLFGTIGVARRRRNRATT